MNQFSTTKTNGGICVPCQNGNIFYLGNPEGVTCPPIKGFVNNQPVGPLPMCQAVTDKTQETTGAIELEIKGKKYPLIKSIDDYGQCNLPNQIQVHIGLAKAPPPMTPLPQPQGWKPGPGGVIGDLHSSNRSVYVPKDRYLVTTIEVDAVFGPPPNGEGAKNIDSLTPAEQVWLSSIVSFFVKNQGAIKDVGGLMMDTTAQIRGGNNWLFLKEMGFTKMKIWKNGKGTLMVSFAGSNKLRSLVTGTNYSAAGLAGKKISLIESAVNTSGANARAATKALGSKAGVIGMIFIAAVDISVWIADPSTEKELSDLFVDLGFDLAIAAISAVAGAVIAGAVLAGAALVTGIAAPVAVVVVAGILVAVGIGMIIGAVIDYSGARDAVKSAIRNAKSDPINEELYRGMMTAP